MEKKRIVMSLGLVIALAALGGTVFAADLHLPPAGEDTFPATKLELEFVSSLGETETITCAGPTTIQRSDPLPGPTGQTIETEIVELNLDPDFENRYIVQSCNRAIYLIISTFSLSTGILFSDTFTI